MHVRVWLWRADCVGNRRERANVYARESFFVVVIRVDRLNIFLVRGRSR